MNKRDITTKQQLLEIIHSKPKSKEELQQEADLKDFQLLCQLHSNVGERISAVEQAHEDQQPESLHRFAVGMLDIELHKEMRCVERMIEEKQKQHDLLYHTYTQMEKRERFKEERSRCLEEKLGPNDAAVVMDVMGAGMKQHEKEKSQQREELKRKISLA